MVTWLITYKIFDKRTLICYYDVTNKTSNIWGQFSYDIILGICALYVVAFVLENNILN